jgi:NAD(P) transhydrogenase subunit alpha
MILVILIASETNFTAETLIPALYVFALAAFLGYQVISRVPPLLHTPLMSATNAISGISLVGSIVTAGAQYNMVSTILGVTAVTCATINVVGGFMITDRMLRMFKRRIPAGKEAKELGAKEKGKLASKNDGRG